MANNKLTVREHINNHSMLEAMANGYYQIQSIIALGSKSEIYWSGTYTEHGWTASITGRFASETVTLRYAAATVYDAAERATSTFSAFGGVNGADNLVINGSAVWTYDPKAGGYRSMIYQDRGVGRAGTPAMIKWWVLGAEVIGGGIIGGALGGFAGAILVAELGLTCSKLATAFVTDGSDPIQPTIPDAPKLPATVAEGQSFVPAGNQVVTRVVGDGTANANLRNQVILTGNWGNGRAAGKGSANITG